MGIVSYLIAVSSALSGAPKRKVAIGEKVSRDFKLSFIFRDASLEPAGCQRDPLNLSLSGAAPQGREARGFFRKKCR